MPSIAVTTLSGWIKREPLEIASIPGYYSASMMHYFTSVSKDKIKTKGYSCTLYFDPETHNAYKRFLKIDQLVIVTGGLRIKRFGPMGNMSVGIDVSHLTPICDSSLVCPYPGTYAEMKERNAAFAKNKDAARNTKSGEKTEKRPLDTF